MHKDRFNSSLLFLTAIMGNIALKVSESCADFIIRSFIGSTKKSLLGKLGLLLMLNSLKGFRKKIDYAEYGGAPLLGVDGIVIIGHGRSNAIAVKNAIKIAAQEAANDLTAKIKEKVR